LSEKCDFMGDTREISSLSLSLPAVTHAEGTVDAGVYISPVLRSGFPCGTSRIAPEFSSDLFWLVVPTITCLYLFFSHDLSLIVILNCPTILSLKFFKGKHRHTQLCQTDTKVSKSSMIYRNKNSFFYTFNKLLGFYFRKANTHGSYQADTSIIKL
jgi:hypothetical protein